MLLEHRKATSRFVRSQLVTCFEATTDGDWCMGTSELGGSAFHVYKVGFNDGVDPRAVNVPRVQEKGGRRLFLVLYI